MGCVGRASKSALVIFTSVYDLRVVWWSWSGTRQPRRVAPVPPAGGSSGRVGAGGGWVGRVRSGRSGRTQRGRRRRAHAPRASSPGFDLPFALAADQSNGGVQEPVA